MPTLRHTAASAPATATWAALAFIAGAVLAAAAGLIFLAPGGSAWSGTFTDPYVWRVARFTLWQAALSALLSILFAMPVAHALARRARFTGRTWLIRLLSLPLALPQLVAVMGILSLWGRHGWLARAAHFTGLTGLPGIYGLTGILLAHVFFNMPLAARILTAALERIPGEYWRLAAQLAMPRAAIWRHITWPAMARVIPGTALLIFMLCATSFTVVLILGGGPAATTLEVAIYQALRFDFDPPRAMALSLLQVLVTTAVFFILRRFTRAPDVTASLEAPHAHPAGNDPAARLADAFWIGLAAIFTAAPLAAIAAAGLTPDLVPLLASPALHGALLASLILAAAAAALTLILSWALLQSLRLRDPSFAAMGDLAASLILVIPPVVLGAGWFIILHRAGQAATLAPVLVAAINALMSLPFAWRILRPPFEEAQARYGRLCAALDITGLARLRLVDWPMLRRPLGLAAALSLVLSIGDLGAIALFGSESFRTLPWLLYQKLGSYRTDEAAGLALILLVFILALMALAEALGGQSRRNTP